MIMHVYKGQEVAHSVIKHREISPCPSDRTVLWRKVSLSVVFVSSQGNGLCTVICTVHLEVSPTVYTRAVLMARLLYSNKSNS